MQHSAFKSQGMGQTVKAVCEEIRRLYLRGSGAVGDWVQWRQGFEYCSIARSQRSHEILAIQQCKEPLAT